MACCWHNGDEIGFQQVCCDVLSLLACCLWCLIALLLIPAAAVAVLRRRYVVLMSDGIFEFLDSQQVMEEVHAAARAGQSPSEAAKRLVRLARK